MKKLAVFVLVVALAMGVVYCEAEGVIDLGDIWGGLTSMFSPNTDEAYRVGETAEIGDVSMTMNNVYESRGNEYYTPAEGNEYILIEFTIANNGAKDLTVSTMLCFSTWCDKNSCTISLEALGVGLFSGKMQLDCVVSPGESVTGVIGYEIPDDWQEVSVKYTNEAIFGESAVFAVSRDEG